MRTQLFTLLLIVGLVSCASKAPPATSSELLALAKPGAVKSPTNKAVGVKVGEIGNTTTRARNEVVDANKSIEDLNKRLAEGATINAELRASIDELPLLHQAKMLLFHKRFGELATRSKETIAKLQANLTEALTQLGIIKIQLSDAEEALVINESETQALIAEAADYRLKWDTLTKVVVDHEKSVDGANTERDKWMKKAKSREKYVWFFYGLVVLVGLAALARFKFGWL